MLSFFTLSSNKYVFNKLLLFNIKFSNHLGRHSKSAEVIGVNESLIVQCRIPE